MQGVGSNALVGRMIGFARLDTRTIEDVERDQSATSQALIVVLLAVVASAIGTLGGDNIVRALIGGAVSAVLGWIVFSVIAYFVGASIFATGQTSVTIGQVLRVVGFAQTPKLLVILGFIPLLGWLAWIIAYIWFAVVAIIAIRQAFEFTIERAVGTAVVALIGQLILDAIIFLIIDVPIWLLRNTFS